MQTPMSQTILVPTAGSDHAGKAAVSAGHLRANCDAELVLLHFLLRGHSGRISRKPVIAKSETL